MDDLTEWWNRISLRTKITGVTVLLLTMGLVVAGVGTMAVLRNYLQDEVDADLKSQLSEIPQVLVFDEGTEFDDDVYSGRNYYLAAVSGDGVWLGDNLGEDYAAKRPDVSDLSLRRLQELPQFLTITNTKHTSEWRVMALPGRLTTEDNEPATLLIGLDMAENNAIINRYVAIFLFFGLTVVILGGALTRLLVTSTFAPLREVEDTAARFADGDFNQRLAGATPNTEVGRLTRSLNSMLGRIDRAFADRARTIEQMRRFVGDASHELRTPLVSVRGYAELYRMGALTKPEDVAQAMERIEKEAVRMGELVEDLLELARLDEAKPRELAEVDLVPLAGDAALDAMASAPDRVVTVVGTDTAPAEPADPPTKVLQLPEPAPEPPTTTAARGVSALATGPIAFAGATLSRLRRSRQRDAPAAQPLPEPPPAELRAVVLAEENKIRQVLANLIGNALRFTPPGSPIEIGVGVDADRRMAVLSVIDHGEGIPPQIREKIFQRFWRADTSRTRETGGSGLGLAIVSAIVAAHEGEVDVVETPGGGATFRVLLPLANSGTDAPAAPTEA